MKADAHDTSRRAFLRRSAAAVTLAAPAAAATPSAPGPAAAAATIVAATAPLPLAAGTPLVAAWPGGGSVLAIVADPGSGGPDAAHVEAERELARVLDEIHAVPRPQALADEPAYFARVEPLWRRVDALEELIATTPAA